MTKKALPVVDEDEAAAAFSEPKNSRFYMDTAKRMREENPVLFAQWCATVAHLPREARTYANRATIIVYRALRAQAMEERRCLPVVAKEVIRAAIHESVDLWELYLPTIAARMCAYNTELFDQLCRYIERLPDDKRDVTAEAAYLLYAYLDAQASVDELELIYNG